MMLYAGASDGARVLQEHRRPSRKLVLQPPPPEHTSAIHRCHPRRVRLIITPSSHDLSCSPLEKINHCPRLIVVDSTRAGKRLPDALSKTVAIWCAVINRAIRLRGGIPSPSPSDIAAADPDPDLDVDVDLRTPPGAVSPHEHAQIAARLDGWATALAVRAAAPPSPALILPCCACTHTGLVVCPAA